MFDYIKSKVKRSNTNVSADSSAA